MSADQWFGAAIIAGAIVTIAVYRRESRLRREASPVVPLDDLLHEQDSAEAYDDLPDMDVEAGIILHGRIEWIDSEGIKRVFGPSPVDEVRARKEWADEWNARLKLDFDGGAR